MIDNSQLWMKRAMEVIEKGCSGQNGYEAVQLATSMLTALYGPQSSQLRAFQAGCEAISKKEVAHLAVFDLCSHAHGAIRNACEELKSGLVTNMRVIVAGEVFGELVRLARETSAEKGDGAKNVAAVLTAAAYEDLMRRMGEEFAGISDRPDLHEVIRRLKEADVLRGGQVGVAQSYLKFRNDSLHADWKNVDRSQVESCLAFIESLLAKHFS